MQSQHEAEQIRASEDLVRGFIEYSMENPHVMLGTYLRSMAIISGLAMRMCDMGQEHIDEAVESMRQAMIDAYKEAGRGIDSIPIQ